MIYFISLGSNVGDKTVYLQKAVEGLRQFGQILKKSSLYRSEPVGEKDQDYFLNAVIKFECDLKPIDLFDEIKILEKNIGRIKTYRWGPREIDIDIIEYDGPLIKSDKLNIPHIEMENRKFVLLPWMEIENNFKMRNRKSFKQTLQQCTDNSIIELVKKDW